MAKYIKLGSKATSYSHPNGVNLVNDAVVKVKDGTDAHPDIAERLQHGHLSYATQAEYEAYQAKKAKREEEGRKEGRKLKLAKEGKFEKEEAKAEDTEEEVDETDTDDSEDKDFDEDGDEDDDDVKTQGEMIDALKANPLVEKDAKALAKLSAPKLKALYDKMAGK